MAAISDIMRDYSRALRELVAARDEIDRLRAEVDRLITKEIAASAAKKVKR